MQRTTDRLLAELKADPRKFVELVEFYAPYEDLFTPDRARFRFGTANSIYLGQPYAVRLLPTRDPVRRFLSSEANTVNLAFNNADQYFSILTGDQSFEGMWCVLRAQSTTYPDEALSLFTGRCGNPTKCDRERFALQVKQDVSIGDAQFPPRIMEILCPLIDDFKGPACRGNKPLNLHTAAFRAAVTCNGTQRQCVDYGNEVNFQGSYFRPISGTFSYVVEEVKKFLLIFKKKKRRTVSAPWSSVNDTAEGTPVAEIGGIVQVLTQPVMHADTGAKVKILNFIGNGPLDGVFEVRCRDKQYLPLLDNIHIELGIFGSEGQGASVQFPGAGNFSGAAYIEGEVIGSDPLDANDSSPTVTCIVRGRKFDAPDAAGQFTQFTWTDCGPYMARWYLINLGGLPATLIDDARTVESGLVTFEPVIDDTGVEQAIIPSDLTGGVDFKAFASASGFGQATVDKIALMMAQGRVITGGYGQLVEAYYRYINQLAPPPFIAPIRKVRRRYTSNFVINEQSTLSEFLHDVLLPSFNGRLIYGTNGKIYPYVERAADGALLTDQPTATATEIGVEDITKWRRNLEGLILIGAHQESAEINRVRATRYAALPTAIGLLASGSGGVTVSAPGSLSGVNDLEPDSAVVQFGGG